MASLKSKILALVDHSGVDRKLIDSSFSPGYHRDSLNKSMATLLEEGLVIEREGLLSLSPKGERGLRLSSPFFTNRGQTWDGLWRLVFFDFPEVSRDLRDRFRRELRLRGFGLWQNSVWVSPFSHDFFDSPEIFEPAIYNRLELIKGIRISGSDERELAAKIWSLWALNKSYQDLYTKWQENFTEVGTADMASLRSLAAELQDKYLTLLFGDPGLPQELLPEGWGRGLLSDVSWQWRKFLKL